MNHIRFGLSVLGLFGLITPPVQAQFTPALVVQTGVNYTGAGTFTQFPAAPSISGATIAFPAAVGGTQGVYTVTGTTVTPVVTTASSIPGGSGNFATFAPYPVALSANGVAFDGNGTQGPGNTGDYTTVSGAPAVVVNNITAFPTGGLFGLCSIPSLSGTNAVFAGTNVPGPPVGVFSRDGTGPLNTVVSTSTAVPFGSGNFSSFTDPVAGGTIPNVSGGNVVFNGQGGGRVGVYTSVSGVIGRVADNTISAPGGSGTFSSFGITPSIDGTDVAFYGVSSGRTGIYLSSGGTLSRVADTTTAVPGGTGTFTGFLTTGLALSGGRVVFQGTDSAGKTGVYSAHGGSIQKVVAVGDVLNGNTLTAVSICDFAYGGGDTACSSPTPAARPCISSSRCPSRWASSPRPVSSPSAGPFAGESVNHPHRDNGRVAS
jgi:hypothetical protein